MNSVSGCACFFGIYCDQCIAGDEVDHFRITYDHRDIQCTSSNFSVAAVSETEGFSLEKVGYPLSLLFLKLGALELSTRLVSNEFY